MRKGFTLVEVTMAVGLMAMLVVMSGVFFTDVLRISSTIGRSNDSQQAPRVVLEEFKRTTARSARVDAGQSRFSVSDGRLVLQQTVGESIILALHDGAVWYERGTLRRRLTRSGTVVDRLMITPVRSSDTAVDAEDDSVVPDLISSVIVDLAVHDVVPDPRTGMRKDYALHFAVAVPTVTLD